MILTFSSDLRGANRYGSRRDQEERKYLPVIRAFHALFDTTNIDIANERRRAVRV